MMNPGSLACGKGARHRAARASFCLSRIGNVRFALGIAVSLAAGVSCSGDERNDLPESQSGGLAPGSGGAGPGGAAGQGGGSTATPGGTGGGSAGLPSGGSEGLPPTDIPLGTGGTSGDSSAGASDAGSASDAGAPPVDPTLFAPCPADGSPCRIMPLGDSITDGIDPAVAYASNAGYRLELFRLALAAGQDITFVGTRPPNGPTEVDGQPFPRAHEGISGNTIEQVADRVDAALAANPPHIVLLQIGTNNLYQGMAAAIPEQLAGLIDQITDAAPDALVAVAQITPLGGQFPNNGVDEYNAAIPGIVLERVAAGKHLIVVDQFTRIAATPNFVAQLLPDNIHPNAAGYAIMGETWYDAIQTFLR